MQGAILITYASRYGSTAEVAEVIAQEVGRTCGVVDVAPVQRVRDLRPYRAVILGSAVRAGRWLPEAIAFLTAQRSLLRLRFVAGFLTCGLLRVETDDSRSAALQIFHSIRHYAPDFRPLETGLFAGCVPPEAFDNGSRILARQALLEPGDWRNWDAIRAWGGGLACLLGMGQALPMRTLEVP